jgi:hypothetical protein
MNLRSGIYLRSFAGQLGLALQSPEVRTILCSHCRRKIRHINKNRTHEGQWHNLFGLFYPTNRSPANAHRRRKLGQARAAQLSVTKRKQHGK